MSTAIDNHQLTWAQSRWQLGGGASSGDSSEAAGIVVRGEEEVVRSSYIEDHRGGDWASSPCRMLEVANEK